MTVYNLEENPEVFISATNDKFCYDMDHVHANNDTMTFIRQINLKSDRLMIYGSEIKGSIDENIITKVLRSIVFNQD